MPTATRLSHMTVASDDKDRLLDWYCKALGGRIVWNSPGFGMMSFDDEHHRIGVSQRRGDPQPEGNGLSHNHVAFAMDNAHDLLEQYGIMKSHGYEPVQCQNHGITLSIYYNDPDGNRIELFVDLIPRDEVFDFMNAEAFSANPGGIHLDPAELYAKMKAGASDEELTYFDAELNIANAHR